MAQELSLFELQNIAEANSQKEKHPGFESSDWGTFKDSLRSPIHNWFQYPAGFSNKAVVHAIEKFGISESSLIYDPFCGTGTTNIVAKASGIDSIGFEAHPFVYFVAKTKSCWTYKLDEVLEHLKLIETCFKKDRLSVDRLSREFPELVLKCYSISVLSDLFRVREAIKSLEAPPRYKDLYNLALTCILRPASNVGTGWPYIAPGKKKTGKDKDIRKLFTEMVLKMYSDVDAVRKDVPRAASCKIVNADCRNSEEHVEGNTIDFIFTSPPYLNNYDYADRTRLETYFFGWMKSWGEITEKVRTRLIMSATTQINRGDYDIGELLSNELKQTSPQIAGLLQDRIERLMEIRLQKGGKKSYDILTAGYFNDMFMILRDCFRVLKTGSTFALILGDSAPYGVHVATDVILGDLAKAIGYSSYEIEELRKRGEKWKDNPQRHKIPLHEAILYLRK